MTISDMRHVLENSRHTEITDIREDAIDFKTGSDYIKLETAGRLDSSTVTETRLSYDSHCDMWTVRII